MIITTCKFIELCNLLECPEVDEGNAPNESTCPMFKAFMYLKREKARAAVRAKNTTKRGRQ